MPKGKTNNHLERLERLTSRLKVDEPIVMHQLAQEFEISLSTLNRDIRILKDRGLPIETDIGRGGGVRMNPSWGMGRISLTPKEVIDLLVSLASIDQMDIPMMFGNARSIRAKLIASFSKHQQGAIKEISTRIKVGPTSSSQTIATYRPEPSIVAERIQHAFLFMKTVDIKYQRADGEISKKKVAPHYMILNHPIWYILGWDYDRNDIRTFRMDRIYNIKIDDREFKLLPWEKFENSIKGNQIISL